MIDSLEQAQQTDCRLLLKLVWYDCNVMLPSDDVPPADVQPANLLPASLLLTNIPQESVVTCCLSHTSDPGCFLFTRSAIMYDGLLIRSQWPVILLTP